MPRALLKLAALFAAVYVVSTIVVLGIACQRLERARDDVRAADQRQIDDPGAESSAAWDRAVAEEAALRRVVRGASWGMIDGL